MTTGPHVFWEYASEPCKLEGIGELDLWNICGISFTRQEYLGISEQFRRDDENLLLLRAYRSFVAHPEETA